MQCHISYYSITGSLTTDMNHVSQNPRVPVAQQPEVDDGSPGVRVHYFLLLAVC